MYSNAALPPATETRGHQTITIVIIFTILALIAVALRGITRFWILKSHGWDDIFIGIAMIGSIATGICQCQQVRYGSGKHVQYVTEFETMMSLKYLFFSIHFYNTGLCATKAGILLLYRRIFTYRSMNILSTAAMVLVACYWITVIVSGILMCIPVDAFWTGIEPKKCVDQFKLYFANAGINIGTDFMVLLLPITYIWRLQVSQRQKITLAVVMSLGTFTCLMSILRLYGLIVLSKSKDPTWEQPATAYWSSIELNMGIICASLPTLKPFITKVAPRILGTERASRMGYSGHSSNSRFVKPKHNHMQARPNSFTMLHLGRDTQSQESASVYGRDPVAENYAFKR
ncbi:hypothetical protein FQN55_001281 [Onygenales sp. PD_40]|nr:hypothetical protein FQN55_001281 [Onygenales sp. PD_40]KAK2780708.1 hypothetical protein FQN53_001036 [Emmonsiellopsis sp. PD_33]KAK2784132.1 hypothetical protein FQN52_009297 [Onygenales sp. PD_12]KAK2801916.1 hypothetical protein FQN51_005065 [Onygenales sp. PD_10]